MCLFHSLVPSLIRCNHYPHLPQGSSISKDPALSQEVFPSSRYLLGTGFAFKLFIGPAITLDSPSTFATEMPRQLHCV